jgi:nucleoside-diphosphate-sugar epimerase
MWSQRKSGGTPANKASSTGGTGYIGGSVLEAISNEFPTLQITALLRFPSAEFTSRFTNIQVVTGDFDAFDVIEKAAGDADIVIRKLYRQ